MIACDSGVRAPYCGLEIAGYVVHASMCGELRWKAMAMMVLQGYRKRGRGARGEFL